VNDCCKLLLAKIRIFLEDDCGMLFEGDYGGYSEDDLDYFLNKLERDSRKSLRGLNDSAE
jgi:hypothetical protein